MYRQHSNRNISFKTPVNRNSATGSFNSDALKNIVSMMFHHYVVILCRVILQGFFYFVKNKFFSSITRVSITHIHFDGIAQSPSLTTERVI